MDTDRPRQDVPRSGSTTWALPWLAVFGVGALAVADCVAGPVSALPEHCNTEMMAWDSATLFEFEEEVQDAFRRRDLRALTLLVRIPLTVVTDRGRMSLSDEEAIALHEDLLFGRRAVRAVLSEGPGGWGCGSTSFGWGGVVFAGFASVGEPTPRIVAIDVRAHRSEGTSRFVCATQAHRFAVSTRDDEHAGLAGWTRPRRLSEKPDIVLEGTHVYAGTGVCRHSRWTFRDGPRTWELASPGCTNGVDVLGRRGLASLLGPVAGEVLEQWPCE